MSFSEAPLRSAERVTTDGHPGLARSRIAQRNVPRRRRWRSFGQKPRFLTKAALGRAACPDPALNMSSPGLDIAFERRLSALVNCGQPQILQGGRKGLEKESLRVTPEGRLVQTPHPAGARLGAHQRAHHHRLFRGADRARHAHLHSHLGAVAVPPGPASVRLPPSGRVSSCGRPACRRHIAAMRTSRSPSTAARTSAT